MASPFHESCQAQAPLLHFAAAALPRTQDFDAAWLRRCAARRDGTSLLSAYNLAPAGTGSSTLAGSLRALSPSNNRLHHKHGWRAGHALCSDQPKRDGELPHGCPSNHPTSCCTCPTCNVTERSTPFPPSDRESYVMTLRDPATRFESMVLMSLRNWRLGAGSTTCSICPDYRFRWKSAAAYLNDFRNASAPQHRAAVVEYRNSVANPHFSHRLETIFGGNNFMTSQADYLRGINCSEVELHFVCQEAFDAGWAALQARFESPSLAAAQMRVSTRAAASGSLNTTISAETRSSEAHADDLAASQLSSEDRDFVRNCMFPWDAALHALACPQVRRASF